jgi:AcrR family transcriptional regulator
MAQKQTIDQSKRILETALILADTAGWGAVTLKAVAKKSRIALNSVESLFPDVFALLTASLAQLELATLAEVKTRLDGSWRENLFEIIMTRLEISARHKNAYASLPTLLRQHPKYAAQSAKPFLKTMRHMLKLAEAPSAVLNPLSVTAFGVLYLTIVDGFLKDDTQDLSKTMALLDHRLVLFEKFAAYLQCKSHAA